MFYEIMGVSLTAVRGLRLLARKRTKGANEKVIPYDEGQLGHIGEQTGQVPQ